MAGLEAYEGISLLHENNSFDSDDEADLNSYNKGKICLTCRSFKPLRAHHCSICNACVLRMDHHCRNLKVIVIFLNIYKAWINNCVGHQNQRFFLLMLFYLVIGTGFYSMVSLPIAFNIEYQVKKVSL